MALGAFSKKVDTDNAIHHLKFTLVGDGAYPTGGTAGIEAFIGLKLGKSVKLIDVKGIGTGYILSYDRVNDKLMAFDGTLTEPSNLAVLSGVTFDCIATYQ